MPTINTATPRVGELENQWYRVRVSGLIASAPIDQVQYTYWSGKVGGTGIVNRKDLELLWMRTMIANNGSAPSAINLDANQLWKEVNASFGYQVSKRVQENKRIFFITNTGTP